MLLEEYTNLNREDSFCYWLEQKTYKLGSIWGGSSYKFGIYRYEKRPDNPSVVVSDEEYAWYKKYNASNKDEAYQIVLKAIVSIAESASKGDFEAIEEDNTFGTVVKWKIAFLYANEMLLPFYKRDMLEKLASAYGYSNPSKAKIYELQHFLMAQKGDKDLYEFTDELLDVMKEEQLKNRAWLFAPGEKACMWSECKESQTMRLGWDSIGDISDFKNREELTKALQVAYENDNSSFRNDSLALWQFVHDIQEGDIVYAKKGVNKIIGRGIVKGDYLYDDSLSTYRHIRKVKWTHIGDWDWLTKKLPLKTLTDISNDYDFVEKVEEMITQNNTESIKSDKCSAYINLLLNNRNLILNGAPGTGKTYLAKQIAAQIIYEGNVPDNFESDATFINQCKFVQFHPSYDYTDFVEGLRPTPPNADGNIGFERKNGIFKEFCKWAVFEETVAGDDDSAGYDFISCYKSLADDIKQGKVKTIQLKSGESQQLGVGANNTIKWLRTKDTKFSQNCVSLERLRTLYEEYDTIEKVEAMTNIDSSIRNVIGGANSSYYWAVLHEVLLRMEKGHDSKIEPKNSKYIFIIDEINRGEISKIFGELFFSIDPGYRGKRGKVQTQYQNIITDETDPFKDGFYIPENVYIIGTMNDIDRSVECMDFAMRRRFTFKEITAEESAKNMELSAEAIERMMSLNNAISEIEGLNSSFHIGAAYFKDEEDYDALWNLRLEGLLREYLRGMPDAEESLETLRKAYYLDKE